MSHVPRPSDYLSKCTDQQSLRKKDLQVNKRFVWVNPLSKQKQLQKWSLGDGAGASGKHIFPAGGSKWKRRSDYFFSKKVEKQVKISFAEASPCNEPKFETEQKSEVC